jgi:class 3 adenylate cyclase/tetratricopeptide (TPR) repeat protein
MQQIADWLEKLGMSEYAERFAKHRIDLLVLPELTDQDLKDLGVALGDRRKMLRAIRERAGDTPVTPQTPAVTGARLQDAAERRQLTVMVCDLVGSTALSTRLDPEDLREIISAYHRRCTEVIDKHGGFVAKYMGDGVLAYFGYPQAHEDDAERAVRAGLALVGPVTKLDAGSGTALQMRVGIATGLVVVGDHIADDPSHECEVVGETPNLAARLQVLAEPDTVVIDSNTHRLLGYLFEYHTLGLLSVKGFDNPLAVWQVVRVSAVDSRFEALRATTTPLIGRDEEIDLLRRQWDQAKRGDGCVVLISGEPGIGKSRIAQTVLEWLSVEPHTPLRLFCSPHHQDSAFYPSITQLQRAAGFRRADTADQRLDKLEAVLAQGTNDVSEAAPLLAALLSIPIGTRYRPLGLRPEKQKEKTLKALLAQVEGLAARQPVLMVFEDAQWSDPTTRELLDLLVDRVSALRVLVILTFRPEFAPPWVGRTHVTPLSLSRLRPRQSADMIARLTGDKALPKEIVDQIIDRSDGIPLFIEELTKTVVESGVFTAKGDCYMVQGPLPPPAVPTSLSASLLARLDRMAPVRGVAQIGAALGRQFSHELISAVAPIPQQQLDDALAQLVTAGLIFRRSSPPDAQYTFKHALVQDAAYSTLLRSRRQQLHGRITATLERQFPEMVETQPELLARHCAEAGLVEKAVGYWLKAGQQAITRWAMTEAVAQLRKGLDLLFRLPDGAARQEQELNLQMTIGDALIATKGYSAPEPGEAFARARQLCEHLDRPTQLGSVLYGQWAFRIVRGEMEQAQHHAEEMRQLGEARNDVMWKYFGSYFSGTACSFLGKFIDARASFENAHSLWNPMYRTLVLTPEDPYVTQLIHLSWTLLCLGYVDQAGLRREEALAGVRRLSPYSQAYVLCFAWVDDWIARPKSAQLMLRSAEEVLAISSEQSFPLWLGVGNVIRGWCLGTLGQAAEGIPPSLEGLAIYRAIGCNLNGPLILMMLAELYGMAGQPDKGLDWLAEAAKLVETTQERWAEAELHRMRGALLLSVHQHAAAEDSYRRALAVARRQSAKFWELRAALDLARLWRDQNKRTEARDLLAPIYGWFTEGFDTPVLQDARALLDELA